MLALRQESKAQDIRNETDSNNIEPGRLLSYNETLSRRNDRMGATVSFGATVALGATGLLLHSFDQPSMRDLQGMEKRSSSGPANSPEPTAEPSMEMGAAPLWSPEMAGAAVIGRF